MSDCWCWSYGGDRNQQAEEKVMDDDTTRGTTNSNDSRLGQFVGPKQGPVRLYGVPIALKPGSDAGSWRSALLILTVSLVIIAVLTYLLHLPSGLVYALVVGVAILAGLVWNQVLGHRR